MNEHLSDWLADGYAVEREVSLTRASIIRAISDCKKRTRAGEDVKLIMAVDADHALILVRK